jgi:hypothetical protein
MSAAWTAAPTRTRPSTREREVLYLLVVGCANLARSLGISSSAAAGSTAEHLAQPRLPLAHRDRRAARELGLVAD